MNNPFNLSDDKLKILLDAFTNWYQNNPEDPNFDYTVKQQEKTKHIQSTLLNKSYLENTPDEKLVQDILAYRKALEGPVAINIGEPRVSGDLEELKRNLLYLIDSNEDPITKAARILEGDYNIPFFAKAFWTPIFQAQHPDVLPNWNNKTENFLKKVGINVKTSKLSDGEKYKIISDAFIYLKTLDPKQNFYHINHLMHFGTVIDKGYNLLDKLINGNGRSTTKDNDLAKKLEGSGNGGNINPIFTISECSDETGLSVALLNSWRKALERKKQAIIYGPPGTGKTFVAECLAEHLIGGTDGFSELVQFHPAYAYEDFIQGLRPKARDDGGLDYPLLQGRFLQFCEKAESCRSLCVLIIDEINRANLARVFGELMYLLEYRDREIPLASGGLFHVPDNVRIIGTMNTADRSIALVDHALRRRFAFFALYPNYEVLKKYHQKTGFNVETLIGLLQRLNKQIGDRHYEVGISFFLRQDISQQIEDIWSMEIEPYLEEYFFDQPDKADEFRWEKICKEIQQ